MLRKVLLVDDDEVSSFVSEQLLRAARASARISFAANGLEALERVRETPFSLVLLDLNMPVMGGFEVLEALERLQKDTGMRVPPVVVLSSSVAPPDRQRAEEHPFVKGYIVKPLSEEGIAFLTGLAGGGAAPVQPPTLNPI